MRTGIKATPEWKAAHSRRQTEVNYQRRVKWLQENGPCKQCASWIDLEVDHINPEEKSSHSVWSWSDEKRLAELAKCQTLCRICHKKKTGDYNRSRNLNKPGIPQKLTEAQVLEIYRMAGCGFTVRHIAGQFDINHSTVVSIKLGYTWSWLTGSKRRAA